MEQMEDNGTNGQKEHQGTIRCTQDKVQPMELMQPMEQMQQEVQQVQQVQQVTNPAACEECFKYWMHFLNQGENVSFINEIADAINELNFGLAEGAPCVPGVTQPVNPRDGVECLSIAAPNSEDDLAQLFEICLQLDFYLRWQVEDLGVPPTTALAAVENRVLTPIGSIDPNSKEGRVVIGLFDCLEESYLPGLFPCPLCIENALTDDQRATFEVYLGGFGLTLETYCALFVTITNCSRNYKWPPRRWP